MTDIDVILPLYRPHPGWDDAIVDAATCLRENFGKRDWRLHLYLVNDGSPASCYPAESLEKIRAAAGDFDFLGYEKNRGKGYSLRYGVAHAKGAVQVYTDADFPFGWESVVSAAGKVLAGADIVMGVRDHKYGEALCTMRKWISGTMRWMNRLLLGLPRRYTDTQAGLKGFNAGGRRVFLATTTDSFLFDTEFILLGYKSGMKLDTLELHLRDGLRFSRMGMRVLLRELGHLARILWRVRVLGKTEKDE